VSRLYKALEKANHDEAIALCAILKCSSELGSRRALLKERLDIFMGRRFAGVSNRGTYPYRRLCLRVASILETSTIGSDVDIEANIVEHVAQRFNETIQASTANTFSEILAAYDRQHKTQLFGTFAAGGFIAVFRAGGFDSYMAASIVLHSVTGALGITLPFGAYTALSSTLATAIGPIAWLGLGVSAFGALKKLNDVQFLPLVIWTHIAMLTDEEMKPNLLLRE
jgi:hypothetical protein